MNELNSEQLMAVKAVDGPVIVFAGAGSGKTRTLTYRIAYMITHENIKPLNILAITFTNKATNEMKTRLKSFLDINTQDITITTFHSLCARILRREITALGYNRSFTIVDEEDQLKIINEIIKEMNEEKGKAKYIQKAINYSKCFMATAEDKAYPMLEVIHKKYEEKMKEMNTIDFEDLLIKVYELFTKFPECLERYQEKFKYILVDEFQDTSLVQYKIVKMLASKYRNIFVVGDDDQSIYSFRGTNYENVSLFKEDFPECQLFTLCENYRSTQSILDVANRLISNNRDREPKKMFCKNQGELDNVVVYEADDEHDEVSFVIRNIKGLKSASNDYTDFAVLYRSSVLLRNIELGFIKRNIPYKVYGGVSYMRRKEIKDIIAYFRLILNNDSVIDFKRIINTPTRGIGNVTLDKILSIRKSHNLNLLEAITWSETVMPPKRFEELKKFRDLILKYSEKIQTENLLKLFEELVSELNYHEYLKSEYEKDDALDRIANLNEFKSVLYTIENLSSNDERKQKIRELFDEATLSDDQLQNQKESKAGVTLSTIHSVKGLEYKYVFLVGMEEDIFPNNMRLSSTSDLEEERRIAYVAITRAKEKVFISYAVQRMLYGKFFNHTPSRFLLEAIGANDLDKKSDFSFDDLSHEERDIQKAIEAQKKEIELKTNSEKKDDTDEYHIGDYVIHKTFGEGIVLSIDKGIGNIFFGAQKTCKSIMLSHPSIRKK